MEPSTKRFKSYSDSSDNLSDKISDNELDYNIELPFFSNEIVNELYTIIHSPQVRDMTTINQIRITLSPFVTSVIENSEAHNIALQYWRAYEIVIQQHLNNQCVFENLGYLGSICYSLWCFIYH